jgi:hypothetical protein
MRVLMTGGAFAGGDTIKLLKRLSIALPSVVALCTSNLCMLALERKIGTAMVEIGGRFESIGVVTARTIILERALMRVVVARGTILTESEPSIGQFFQMLILHKIAFMTSAAIYFLMFSGEFVTSQSVVKLLGIPPDWLKIATMVVAMAARAVFALHFF